MVRVPSCASRAVSRPGPLPMTHLLALALKSVVQVDPERVSQAEQIDE